MKKNISLGPILPRFTQKLVPKMKLKIKLMKTKTNDIQATIECGFTLKCVRDMTRTYSQF